MKFQRRYETFNSTKCIWTCRLLKAAILSRPPCLLSEIIWILSELLFDPLWSSNNVWRQLCGSWLVQIMTWWMHQAISWTNNRLSSKVFCRESNKCPWPYSITWVWKLHLQNTEAETKLTPFRRRHFQVHLLERKLLNFKWNFTEICSLWSNWQYGSIR